MTVKIAAFHNYYQQPGGEDVLFAEETALLESKGHPVSRFVTHNDRIRRMGRLSTAACALWSRNSYMAVKGLLQGFRPDVAYFYNTFPLISPAAYYAARSLKIPVVQQLQNYRLLCPGALLFREGRVCEECPGKAFPGPALRHGCYRNSRGATAVVAAMLVTHRILGTWRRMVDMYIVPTTFARRKFMAAGLPGERIAVKPNFVHPDPGPGGGRGGYALFAGRLSGEKGIRTMLAAWERVRPGITLKIAGDGPLAGEVQRAAAASGRGSGRIEYAGYRPPEEILALVGEAAVLIFPSEWYEGMPRTIIESLARGTPVIASRLGAMESMLEHGRTGLLFPPGSAAELAGAVEWFFSHPEEAARMRREARAAYLTGYTGEKNYRLLRKIFTAAAAGTGKKY